LEDRIVLFAAKSESNAQPFGQPSLLDVWYIEVSIQEEIERANGIFTISKTVCRELSESF